MPGSHNTVNKADFAQKSRDKDAWTTEHDRVIDGWLKRAIVELYKRDCNTDTCFLPAPLSVASLLPPSDDSNVRQTDALSNETAGSRSRRNLPISTIAARR